MFVLYIEARCCYSVSMYIERVPNRNSPPAILLRESFRDGGKVRKRTLANLTHWPEAKLEALRAALKGTTTFGRLEEAFTIERSLPHGHVTAVLGTLRRLGLERLLAPGRSALRSRVVAMIVARVVDPRSKLATARGLGNETALSSLGESLELGEVESDDLYDAMDWLLPRQSKVEQALAGRHLADGSLVLYDMTTTWFEGRKCPLGKLGHSKDGKRGKLQIGIGLLCDREGCPVAVEVFAGNVGDPKTFSPQVEKVRKQFGISEVVFVGDRGMITAARIREDLSGQEGTSWITALRAPAVQKLVDGGCLQLNLFDERDLGEITSPDYPGERLIVCRNPLLADERARKRTELLAATEKDLAVIKERTRRSRRPLRGKGQIGVQVGKVLGRFKMAKHFRIEIREDALQFERNEEKIAQETALDGFYVLRTPVSAERMDPASVVRAYKDLSGVERAFRRCKTVDLHLRPIHHRLEGRVRAHVFLCMLAYYVEWHMRRALAPMLFDDDDKSAATAARVSIVAPAQRSARAQTKAQTKHTQDGQPVHSFRTLLADLGTIARNRIRPRMAGGESFDQITRPTGLQQKAFDLLKIPLRL